MLYRSILSASALATVSGFAITTPPMPMPQQAPMHVAASKIASSNFAATSNLIADGEVAPAPKRTAPVFPSEDVKAAFGSLSVQAQKAAADLGKEIEKEAPIVQKLVEDKIKEEAPIIQSKLEKEVLPALKLKLETEVLPAAEKSFEELKPVVAQKAAELAPVVKAKVDEATPIVVGKANEVYSTVLLPNAKSAADQATAAINAKLQPAVDGATKSIDTKLSAEQKKQLEVAGATVSKVAADTATAAAPVIENAIKEATPVVEKAAADVWSKASAAGAKLLREKLAELDVELSKTEGLP